MLATKVIRLYGRNLVSDEDVRPLLAHTLRQRGFEARHIDELKRCGLSGLSAA